MKQRNSNFKLILNLNFIDSFPVLDISGEGDFENLIVYSRMRIKMFGSKYEKNGKIYAKFEKVLVRIQPGKSKIVLKNLFNGDPVLGQVGNQVINQNQELLYDDLVPVMEKQFADTFKGITNQIIENADLDELFPDV